MRQRLGWLTRTVVGHLPDYRHLIVNVRRPCITQRRYESSRRSVDGEIPKDRQAMPHSGYYAELLGHSMQKFQTGARPSQRPFDTVSVDDTQSNKDNFIISSQQARIKRQEATEAASRNIAGVNVPPRPKEPDNCCMSGCVNCVWDMYREELEEWAAKNAEATRRLAASEAESASASPSSKSDEEADVAEATSESDKVEEAMDDIPVGLREFMKVERIIKERQQRRDGH